MKDDLSVIEKNGKFVVAKNGKPVQLPKTDGASIVTEFDSKSDAERYMSIIRSLRKNPAYA